MRSLARILAASAILLVAFAAVANAVPSSPDDHSSAAIVFKDGHRQSFAVAEIARIDFKAGMVVYKDGHHEKFPAADIERIEFEPSDAAMMPGRAHFIGKWEVGEGNGRNFFMTLEENGEAKKTIGSPHGTWTLVEGEAHISWDDGWH